MVNHPTKDKGIWDTIDLTKKAGAKTVKQGVAATKKWHKQNPYNNMKKQLTKKQGGGYMASVLPYWHDTTETKENKLTGVRKRVNKKYYGDNLREKEVIKYNPRTGVQTTRVKEAGEKPKKTQVFLGKDTSTKRKKPVTPTIPPMNPSRPGEAPSTRYMKKGGSIKKKK